MKCRLGILALFLCGCSGDANPGRPNIILISVDTLRADHLGCYDYGRDTSPFLDSLAADGVVFENAFAQSSWTLASHMSLFTARYPHNHGVETPSRSLSANVPTLTEILKTHGYHTFGFVTWAFLESAYGFGRGFDLYRQFVPAPDKRDVEHAEHVTRADQAVDAILEGLGDGVRSPFFLFAHLFDPHLDYAPPAEHVRRFDPQASEDLTLGMHTTLQPYILPIHKEPERIPPAMLQRVTALYDGEIHFTDTQLARLFEALRKRDMLEDTLIVVTSDHGEELDDHGSMEGHGWTLYDEILHVPLIVKFPDNSHAGTRIQTIVEGIDIAPTILEFAGIEAPGSFDGKSLLAFLDPTAAPSEGRTFSSSERFLSRWSVRTERYKLIRSQRKTPRLPYEPPPFEFFDLAVDPGENLNLYGTRNPQIRVLQAYLDAWISTRRQDVATEKMELDEAQRNRLRALGYSDED